VERRCHAWVMTDPKLLARLRSSVRSCTTTWASARIACSNSWGCGAGLAPERGSLVRLSLCPCSAAAGPVRVTRWRDGTLDVAGCGRAVPGACARCQVQVSGAAVGAGAPTGPGRRPRPARPAPGAPCPPRRPGPLWLAWIGAHCLRTCKTRSGAGTCGASPVEHASALRQTGAGAGRRCAPPPSGGRPLDLGCWLRCSGSSGWPGQSWGSTPAWERPRPPERLTPGSRPACLWWTFGHLGTPAQALQPRGKAPGRRPGQRPGPAPRFVVVRRPRPNAA